MRIRKFNKSDEGVVGIIVTILIIGLVIVVYTIIQSEHMPNWLEQKESEHMYMVSNQFSQIKHSIDVLSAIEEKNAISTYITLGISDLPIFGTGQTYDSLDILSGTCNVEITNITNTFSFPIGVIKYSSSNSYFVDQSYIFEAGALILSQDSSSILNGKPFFTVSNFTNISLTIINISDWAGKNSVRGYGTYSIYTEFSDSNTFLIKDLISINITTSYQNAWHLLFNSTTLRYSGLTYDITEYDEGLTVDFSDTLGNLNLKVVDISAQITPGWIE